MQPTALGAVQEQQEPMASLPRSQEIMRKGPHFSARHDISYHDQDPRLGEGVGSP